MEAEIEIIQQGENNRDQMYGMGFICLYNLVFKAQFWTQSVSFRYCCCGFGLKNNTQNHTD